MASPDIIFGLAFYSFATARFLAVDDGNLWNTMMMSGVCARGFLRHFTMRVFTAYVIGVPQKASMTLGLDIVSTLHTTI